jgi:predicted transcriptional regulator
MNKIIRVGDVMSEHFTLIDGLITVADALKLMNENNYRALIVNKRNDDDEYGMVKLSDIAKLVIAKNRAPDRVNVYEIMAKPVVSVPSKMNIRYCARLFDQFGLSSAPVIDNDKVVGVVSYDHMVLNGLMEVYN